MIGPLEIAANAAATIAIFLAGRNSVHTWRTGMVGCGLFARLFFEANLYADVVLHFLSHQARWGGGTGGAAIMVRRSPSR